MNDEVKSPATTPKTLIPKLRFPEFSEAGAWKKKPLLHIIKTITPPQKIQTVQYTKSGLFPIIDQSQNKIAGWTNDRQAIIKEGFPLIIFGDHTCILKIIDQPFAQGADGIKIFYGSADIKTEYLYQYLQFNPLKMEEYKRHFSILKEKIILYPKLPEQQKIAACLSSIDELITAQNKKLEALKTHKKGLMQQLFPAEGETLPKLRFPEFSETGAWNIGVLDDAVKIIDGDRGINYPNSGEFTSNGFCVFLNAKNVTKNGFVFNETQFISQEKDNDLRKGKLSRFDVILTTRGSVGHFAIFSDDIPYKNMRINSGMVILRVHKDLISPEYFYSFCKSLTMSSTIENAAFGNAQQQLTVAVIKNLPLNYPSPEEQQKIAACLSSIDDLITAQNKKLEALKTHKKGLMQQLFPAVNDNNTQGNA